MAINKDILESSQLEALSKKVIGYSKSEWCEVNLNSAHTAHLRYAANMVTTSGSSVDTTVHITCANGKKSGSVSTNDLSDDGLQRAVKRAEEIASLAPDNEELMPPLAEKQSYKRSAQYDEASADSTYAANERAKVAAPRKRLEDRKPPPVVAPRKRPVAHNKPARPPGPRPKLLGDRRLHPQPGLPPPG